MAKAAKLKFEEAVEELERIIEGIESGEVGLEESLAQYEKGMKLIAHCRSILNIAEKRIAELTVNEEGELEVESEEEQENDEERNTNDE